MESWRLVWREGFAPVLPTAGLESLRDALRAAFYRDCGRRKLLVRTVGPTDVLPAVNCDGVACGRRKPRGGRRRSRVRRATGD